MTIFRYTGSKHICCINNSIGHFTFYKDELYEGKWINVSGAYGDLVLNNGDEICGLQRSYFKYVKASTPPKTNKIKFPVTVVVDGETIKFRSMKVLVEWAEDNVSTFCDANLCPTVTDANGMELGCSWSVKIDFL